VFFSLVQFDIDWRQQIGYLIYLVAGEGKSIPTLSLAMIAAIYGLQALVFILRRKWDMIGWMVFYIIAIPAFSFYLPLYSFWKMDDFSWGQTRVVMGESGKKLVVHVSAHLAFELVNLVSDAGCSGWRQVWSSVHTFEDMGGIRTFLYLVIVKEMSDAHSGERAMGQGI
jgi:hypothetical protein